MRAALFLLVALRIAAQSTAPACALQGRVVDALTGKPLAGVKLFAHDISAESETAADLRKTDAQGHFCFERLAPGRYRAVAQRAGYLDQLYGALPGGQQGIELAVKADTKLPPADMKLTPRPVLSGMVLHADAQPAPGSQVTVWQRVYVRDGPGEDSVESGNADDRGIFRFADLAPGTYYLSAQPDSNTGDWLQSKEYLNGRGEPRREEETAAYYPGAPDFAHARPIVLQAGQEVSGLAISLRTASLRRISGRIIGAPATAFLYLDPESDGLNGKQIVVQPDGSFQRSDVLPGKYMIEMHAQGDLVVRQEVDLRDADAENVALDPRETFTLPLVLHAEGNSGAVDLQQLQVTLVSVPDGSAITARSLPEGGFAFTHVSPGTYRLQVYRLRNQRLYLKRAALAGQAQPRDGLDLRARPTAPLELTFSPNVASVEGRVSEMPAGAVTLLLAQPGNEDDPAQATTDQDGTFHFDSVEPGKYRLFAIEGFDEGPWGSPELAAALHCIEIEFGENEARRVTVPLVRAEEWIAAVKRFGQ